MQIHSNILSLGSAHFGGLKAKLGSIFRFSGVNGLSGSSADACLLSWFVGFCAVLLMPQLLAPLALWGLAVLLACFVWRQPNRRTAWLLSLLLAMAYANHQFVLHKQSLISPSFEGQSLLVTGTIMGLPRIDDNRIRFDFKVLQAGTLVNDSEPELASLVGKRLKLNCYRCRLTIAPDQRWRMTVRLKRPRGFASWGAFDYEKYLFRHKIAATGYVRLKEENTLLGYAPLGTHSWRANLQQQFNSVFETRSAGVGMFNALMLGDRSLLSHDQRQVFQITGVSHLMAISGLHIGLVFLLTIAFLRMVFWPIAHIYHWWPRQQLVLLPAFTAAVTYSALAGFSVSTRRALIMLAVYVVCRFCARDLSLLRVLLIAVSVLLVIDPFSILDTGFWLSCFAVLLIAVVGSRYRNLKLWQLQPWLWLGMLPVTALLFGQISLVSPLVNLAAVPLFCLLLIPAVLISLVLMLLGQSGLSTLLASPVISAFDAVYTALKWISLQPLAFVHPEGLAVWQAVLVIGLLFLVIVRWQFFLLFASAAVLLVWPSSPQLGADEYQVTMLDVGQGLAMVIEAQDYVLVYDTGPSFGTGFSTAEAVLLPFLRERGIREIDHLVISHADNDHIGGLATVLRAFPVRKISTSRLDKMPDEHRSIAQHCWAGQQWQVGELVFSFLSPDQATPDGSNNLSCVLKIRNSSLSTLITGDIEKPVERYLLRSQAKQLRADFMLVPHQGSKTSSTALFLDAVQPRLALLAAGYRNHYGHPHDSVVRRYQERAITLVSTIEGGSTSLKINNNHWSVIQFRQAEPRFWRS